MKSRENYEKQKTLGKVGRVGKVGQVRTLEKVGLFQDFLRTFSGQSEFCTDCIGLVKSRNWF